MPTPAKSRVLGDLTNAQSTKSASKASPFNLKRSSDAENSPTKRVKLNKPSHPGPSPQASSSSATHPLFEQRDVPLSAFLASRALGAPRSAASGRAHASVSTRPTLLSFVSSKHCDIIRCTPSADLARDPRPLSCAYSYSALRGGKPLLAIGTTEGAIELVETKRRHAHEFDPERAVMQAHKVLVSDVRWSADDRFIASASGDHTARITDVETRRAVATLDAHAATVRTAVWDPHHSSIISTAGRDGLIAIWDLRVASAHDAQRANPLAIIRPAAGKGAKKAAPVSITSLLYLPHEQHQLISSSSANGLLSRWDLRCLDTAKAGAAVQISSTPAEISVVDPTTLTSGATRPRGLSSIVWNDRTCAIYGLSTRGLIHTYLPQLSTPTRHDAMTTYGSALGGTNSFDVRLSLSPCGMWLASGCSSGVVRVFEVAPRRGNCHPDGFQRGVALKRHDYETTSIDWWTEGLAIASQDATLSIWRPNLDVQQKCLGDPEAQTWNWSWATED